MQGLYTGQAIGSRMTQGADKVVPQLGVVIAVSSVAPDQILAGLSLGLRAVLDLQRLGVARVVVAHRARDAELVELWRGDDRTRVELISCPVEDEEPLLPALARCVDEPFVLARHDRIVDPNTYRRLVEQMADTHLAVLALEDGRPAGPLVGTPELLSQAEDLSAVVEREDVAGWSIGDGWVCDPSTPQGRRRAVDRLFEACRKAVDGFVSRHLNRHVSLWISRRLVDTPITPNAMTVVTFGVAVLAAVFAARGGYASTLMGAALMQLNSILDGCDGELARVRHQGSTLGQWLDTIGDDASNVLFWAALALGARGIEPHGDWLALSGWIAAGANALAALANYAVLAKMGSGDFYALSEHDAEPSRGLGGKLVGLLGVVLKQDSFLLLILVAALLGILHQVLPLIALGAIITMVNAVARALRARRALQSSSRTMS